MTTRDADFTFHTESLSSDELRVVGFSGVEELSRPFHFQIALVADQPDVDLDAQVGRPAVLGVRARGADGLPTYTRWVHGVIERFEQVSVGERYSHYEAALVPTLAPLRHTRNSRIFQRLATCDVVKQVLKEGGVPSDRVEERLQGSYEPRDFCVQYQESDLDFISRLLEEEGISYHFAHAADQDTIVIGDGNHGFDALPDAAAIPFRAQPHHYEEVFHDFRAESALRPGGAVMRDFRFKQPSVDLEARQSAQSFTQYQMYFFPGEYVDPSLGKRLVKIRMEELQCDRRRYRGASTCRALTPGYRFRLERHGRAELNQEYLVVRVEHEGRQPQAHQEEDQGRDADGIHYRNRVLCIPASVPFRPARLTPRPSIPGVQSAIVVGPASEEIHCDEHGRVKVLFHWDRAGHRDDDSSCWIRVSQPWGGAGQGGMFIPRVGQEVLVQFLEGDPDRPVIVGRVYNGENPVPHGLPAGKNVSTIRSSSTPGGGGFNEIRFDDTKDKEEMFLHAQYNRNEIVGNNHSMTVNVDQTQTVKGKRTRTVIGDESVTVQANRNVSVTGKQTTSITGDHSRSVTGKETISVTKDRDITVTGKQSTTVKGGEATLTVTSVYKVNATASVEVTAPTKISLTCGGSSITLEPGKITITAGGGASVTLDANALVKAAVAHVDASSQGKVTAPDISVSGSSKTNVEGGGASLALQGTADLKGTTTSVDGSSSTKVSGGASVEVTGAMIKLN